MKMVQVMNFHRKVRKTAMIAVQRVEAKKEMTFSRTAFSLIRKTQILMKMIYKE